MVLQRVRRSLTATAAAGQPAHNELILPSGLSRRNVIRFRADHMTMNSALSTPSSPPPAAIGPVASRESLTLAPTERSGESEDEPPSLPGDIGQAGHLSAWLPDAGPAHARLTINGFPESPSFQPSASRQSGSRQDSLSAVLGDGVALLGGGAIALLTLLVPLASVISDRGQAVPGGSSTPSTAAASTTWRPSALAGTSLPATSGGTNLPGR